MTERLDQEQEPVECLNCGEKVAEEELDENGLCPDCAHSKREEDDEKLDEGD